MWVIKGILTIIGIGWLCSCYHSEEPESIKESKESAKERGRDIGLTVLNGGKK